VTRSDFDGLVCAVLLVEKGLVDDYSFVHPKDVQDGKVDVSDNDILANVPYVPGCGLWFDHHLSEEERLELDKLEFEGECRPAPSAARVIWDYYGGEATFGSQLVSLLDAVDKTDSADLTIDEILDPQGWILLSFIMDPRTGLGRFKDYRISNYQLMLDMIQYCRSKTAEEILELPDVAERTKRYWEHQELYKDMLKWSAKPQGNVIVTFIMDEEIIYCGNRFVVFAMYPEQNIEARVLWGKDRQNVVFAVGHSIVNRTSQTNVGKLMLAHGGGGHPKVGTCQVPVEGWRDRLDKIVAKMRDDG
jgi:nanoRNase/pAp phosphatase (c-di-AMP/oligoRNAs hydrolase)